MIHQSTLDFLSDLLKNNRREWFAENRHRYDTAKEEVIQTAAHMIELINEFDTTLGFADPRRSLFRINRDTRFSKNKEPYKTHMGMAFSAQGVANSADSSYYIHIDPEKPMLAAGLFMPTPDQLRAVRETIDTNWEEFQSIITAPAFVKPFGGLCRETKILKRAPKGFTEDSPAIEYLKFCSFYVIAPITTKELTSQNFEEKAAKIFEIAAPLHKFLNSAIKND